MFDEQQVFRFFSLFDIPEGHNLLLWLSHPDTQEKRSLFVRTADEAASTLRTCGQYNCYWGVGLRWHQPTPRPHWRGTELDVSALLCLNLDLDVFHPVAHKSTTLPATKEEALRLVDSLPVLPTARLWSGYGIQVFYAFREAELLTDAIERNVARAAARHLFGSIGG